VEPGSASPPARRSDSSWWATSLVALCCGIAVLALNLGLAFLLALSSDSCGSPPPATPANNCAGWLLAQNDWTAGWRLAALALPVGLVSLLVPHRVKWLWLRIPMLLAAVALCAAPTLGFLIGIGHN
jgi:hypothetical protein